MFEGTCLAIFAGFVAIEEYIDVFYFKRIGDTENPSCRVLDGTVRFTFYPGTYISILMSAKILFPVKIFILPGLWDSCLINRKSTTASS